MALIRTGYELVYEDLLPDPALGSVAIVPWDSAIFEFPVASFRAGIGDINHEQIDTFRSGFANWTRAHHITLCSTTLAPTHSFWRQALTQAGFEFVDLALQVTLSLSGAKLPSVRSQLRPALPKDYARIETIAATSFAHGRYHADPRFPQELADRRYLQWVRNTLQNPGKADHVYVLEQDGGVAGFYHVTIENDISDLRLAALASDLKGTMLGVELYSAMLQELRRKNVRKVVTSISALNYNIVNLYSMLGFRFSSPEITYHWHAGPQERQ